MVSVVDHPTDARESATPESKTTTTIPRQRRAAKADRLDRPVVAAQDIDDVMAALATVTSLIEADSDRQFVRWQVTEALRTTPLARLLVRVRARLRGERAAIRRPAGWIAARALSARPGCGDPLCEDGTNWQTGQACRWCPVHAADRRADRAAGRNPDASRPTSTPVASWRCGSCGLPGVGDGARYGGVCRDCWSVTPEGAAALAAEIAAAWSTPAPAADPDTAHDPYAVGPATARAATQAARTARKAVAA
ncbi:hypothetical protein ACIOUE_07185 [Streptomyces xanthochromogenes]|uniref:hypothetical protein n=1 Tax=Streptomyces xanthochromogenes TaxID=67384 RepID=UPI003443D687